MGIPKELADVFEKFVIDSFGAENVTSERERSNHRARYATPEFVILTFSHVAMRDFTVKCVPDIYQERVEESWKSFFLAYFRPQKESQE